ncbi:MAG: sel1 repeat family protein [Bacteroidales bacterium]|nr:sel1 repeat family protein [Bacteroidales bacterium]
MTVSPAANQKADAIYESVRKAYTQGKLSANQVVDKALYHNVWSPELAARCLQLVSDKNNRAKAELGYLYTSSKTAYLFPGKEAEGVTLLETASNSGNKKASDYLGIYYNRNKDYNKAWTYFKAAGPDNIPYALTVIGEMYDKGHGVKKDRPTAREYFRRAALLGDHDGANKYGSALKRQWYGDVDMPDAFFWTYVAGELGDDFARSNLMLPIRGERFGDDTHTAFMRNAMTISDVWNENYGHKLQEEPIYKDGYKVGIVPRTVQAEKGDPLSLFYLGSMSYNDEFLNRNDEFVSKCYLPVIADGTLPAPFLAIVYERMADIYRNGKDIKADPAKVAEYTRKAADYGSLAAYKIVENIPD